MRESVNVSISVRPFVEILNIDWPGVVVARARINGHVNSFKDAFNRVGDDPG
jgi:hypothetical protein